MENREPQLHKMEVSRTAHFYTIGVASRDTKHVWIVLHGYGQLASRIIQKFNEIDITNTYVIAPEALSKFYYSRQPEVLGASWMTKHHRLDEISDYLTYLDQIYDRVVLECGNAVVNILGFSQGNATMWRWIAHRKPVLNSIVMWAGEFPPEPDYKNLSQYINTIPHLSYCVGNEDPFVTPERLASFIQVMKDANLNMAIEKFEGGHRIDRPLLMRLIDRA